ncbi:MAG: hypothetical protein J6V06_06755 [Clostridia bacterium]|nr:hypothetical protein [Clostridia bacterium]
MIGTYEHNIDGKNRLFVPAKFRAVLGSEFIFKICRSKYPSVQLYSKAQFQKEVDEALRGVTAEVLRRNIKAQKYLGTGEAVCDAQGRIVLGGETAKLAKLEKACILTGFGDYVEIMSPEVYEAYNASLLEAAVAEEEAYFAQEELRNEKRSEGAYLETNSTEE